jgi:Ni/Co efflux regulator RcnB
MMRLRLLLATLLAGTIITPVLAQDQGEGVEQRDRGDISRGTIQDRGTRRGPPERPDRAQPQPQIEQQVQGREAPQARPDWSQRREAPAVTVAPPVSEPNNRGWRGDGQRRSGEATNTPAPPPVTRQTQGDNNRNWRGNDRTTDWRRGDRDRDGTPNWRDRDRDNDGVRNNRDWDRNNDGRVDGRWDRDRNGTVDRRWDQNRDGVRDNRDGRNWNNNQRWGNQNWNNNQRWNREWRNDRRYDWQRHRSSNRNLFRQPRYYSPYGYNNSYQRFGIGIYLESILFGSRYRISDPWQYRLPNAQWPYEWVRYYDDVLLVDTRNGYVVDVIYDFFW